MEHTIQLTEQQLNVVGMAEMTAVMNALRDATQTIKAIKDDFHQTGGYGLL